MKVQLAKNFQDRLGETPIEQVFLTPEREYLVHALACFNGQVVLLVADDVPLPAWYSAVLFDVVEPTPCRDWQVGIFGKNTEGGLQMVCGPSFVSQSEQAYRALVELDPARVEKFWSRLGVEN